MNGAVLADGQDATYSFEYGTSTALGSSTATQDAGTGTVPQLVQTSVTGLAPGRKYYFRLVTTTVTDGTTRGPLQSFSTVPSQQTPLTLTTVAHGIVGVPYTEKLTAGGGVAPYAWSLTAGSLPAGLNLNPGSGVISGKPRFGVMPRR